MLSTLDSAGGEDQQLPVTPGDTVPGWGKVVSISQRGTTWVVKTDHGLIQ
jgi:acyl dehydratase